MSCEAYICQRCGKEMVADTNAARHTYVCRDDECGARAVIVDDGTGGTMRWDLPGKVVAFPTTGDTPPKGEGRASSALNAGRGEGTSGAGLVLLDQVDKMIPGGVQALLTEDAETIAERLLGNVRVINAQQDDEDG